MEEIVTSNDMDVDELEEMFERVENGEVIEIDGAFDDQCYVDVVHDQFDHLRARVKTQKKVDRAKRIIELSKGKKNRKYREFI